MFATGPTHWCTKTAVVTTGAGAEDLANSVFLLPIAENSLLIFALLRRFATRENRGQT